MTPEERQRILADIDRRLGEAMVTRSMSDEESQAALIDIWLEDEQRRLEQLAYTDPIGLVCFGDDDAWLDKRLSK